MVGSFESGNPEGHCNKLQRRSSPFILVNSIAALAAGYAAKAAAPPDYLWVLALAVLAGGWAGAEYGSKRLTNPLIRRFLAVVVAVAGGKMVLV